VEKEKTKKAMETEKKEALSMPLLPTSATASDNEEEVGRSEMQ
jgi:hypothetical protein